MRDVDAARRGQATTGALEGLREALARGTLPPGAPVVEEEWAARLGVSRTPVRAAIGVLAGEGLLVKRGRQFHVFQPAAEDLLEVYEIRRNLEAMAASLALRAGPRRLARDMDDDLRLLRASEGTPEWFAHHEQFHLRVVEACGNRRLVELLRSLRLQSEPYVRYAVNADTRFRNRAMSDHRRMVAAVRAGDETGMRDLVERHLDGTVEEMQRLLALTGGYGIAPPLARGAP